MADAVKGHFEPMDVCLIVPPNTFLLDPLMYPPLGPLYIASILEQEGHGVLFLDLRNTKRLEEVRFPKAEYYGLTATTAGYNSAVKIKTLIKNQNPRSVVFIGGVHATVKPDEAAEEFDAVIVGEGERSIFKVLQGAGGIIKLGGIEDIDAIPFPARHLLKPEARFSRKLFEGEKYRQSELATTITSTRGCPFDCAYCASPTICDRKIRFRSAENFVEEVEHIITEYGCRSFKFIDDNFPLRRTRTLEIAELLEPLKINFRCHTRTSLVDEEILLALRKAGCNEIAYGLEVSDDYVLKKIQKHETVEDQKRGVRLAKEAGLVVRLYLMVGLPFETWNTISNTKRFIVENREYIDKYTLSTFAPYPGSDIYNDPDKYSIIWMERDYSKLLQFKDEALIATEDCTREEFTEHRRDMSRFLEETLGGG